MICALSSDFTNRNMILKNYFWFNVVVKQMYMNRKCFVLCQIYNTIYNCYQLETKCQIVLFCSAYDQEIGRAGRTGTDAQAILYFNQGDLA